MKPGSGKKQRKAIPSPDKHSRFSSGDVIFVHAKPGSAKRSIEFDEEQGHYLCRLTSPPADGRANAELIKLFKKELGLKIDIISGQTSRKKKLKIL